MTSGKQNGAPVYREEWEKMALLHLQEEFDWTLQQRKISLPILALELIDSERFWGRWDPLAQTIQISRRLLLEKNWFQVVGVLRHEMAHAYVDFTNAQSVQQPHGEHFQLACEKLGVPENFCGASTELIENSLDWRSHSLDSNTERLMEKVKKLLALAQSKNENESLAAMNKVREIYAKYNLQRALDPGKKKYVHLVIVFESLRVPILQKNIISILINHFFVRGIYGTGWKIPDGSKQKYIELIGLRENCLMAEYVYKFLLDQSLHLMERANHKSISEQNVRMTGLQKKSFRLGILDGFNKKLESATVTPESFVHASDPAKNVSTALQLFHTDKQLNTYLKKIYPRLTSVNSRGIRLDRDAFSDGQIAGKSLVLNKPVESKEKSNRFLGPSRF